MESALKGKTSEGDSKFAERSAVARQKPVACSSGTRCPCALHFCSVDAARTAAHAHVPRLSAVVRTHDGCMPKLPHSVHARLVEACELAN